MPLIVKKITDYSVENKFCRDKNRSRERTVKSYFRYLVDEGCIRFVTVEINDIILHVHFKVKTNRICFRLMSVTEREKSRLTWNFFEQLDG